MTFSINNKGNFKPVGKNNISFKGVRPEYDELSTPVQRFVLPVNLRGSEKAVLEVTNLKKKNGKWEKQGVRTYDFNSQDTIDINQGDFEDTFAYRYKITNKSGKEKIVLDNLRKEKIGDSEWNFVVRGKNEGVSPAGGSMYHVFIDSEGKYDAKTDKIISDHNFVRNHFNKLGGSIASLIYLLDNTDEFDPYKYIISTPDIGVDPTSSHKYWPNNSYQCGNLQDFKNFNWKLFTKGKGYVADGAFTSQSLQSPIVQHVLKWGKNSPLHDMMKIEEKPALGILPDDTAEDGAEARNHIGIRLVNPKGDNYDSKKPTYIQFYDDRLSSQKQINSDGVIKAYDKPNPDDHYDVVTHQDSVQPFYFEISPDDSKIKEFKGKKSIMCKDIKNLDEFLTFDNYKITTKNNASGASFWSGNVDIIKMNLSNPNADQTQGYRDARKYLYGVASYWTELIQSDMLLRTAQASKEERKTIAKNNDVDYDTVSVFSDIAESNVLKQNKTVGDYVKEFPMQSMETSPELSAIFLQRDFKEGLLNKNRKEEVTAYVDSIIENAIPDKYKGDAEYKTYAVKTLSNTVLRNLYAKSLNRNAIDETGNIDLKKLNQVTLKSMLKYTPSCPEDETSQVVDYVGDGVDKTLADKFFKDDLTTKMKASLSKVSLEDFKMADAIVTQGKGGLNWRFDAAKDIGDLDSVTSGENAFRDIWSGPEGVKDFWTNFIRNVKTYNPSAYIVSEITDLWNFYSDQDKDKLNKFDLDGLNPPALEQVFLTETGSTTSSNYEKYFNNLSAFVGVDPENGWNRSNSAGNVEELKSKVEPFIESNQANAIIGSHMFTNNHDKPTVLHTLPLDMELFAINEKTGFKEDSTLDKAPDHYKALAKKITGGREDYALISAKAIAVADAMMKATDKTSLNKEEKTKIKEAIQCLANGQKDASAPFSLKRANAYGYLPFEITIKDALKIAGIEDNDGAKLQEIHYAMMKNSMKIQEGLWEMMNAIPGTPTLYNGTEFAQTGYETPSKNVYVGNRNPILHEMKNKEGYKQYYKKMSAISGLAKEPGMSATRNGYPISLNMVSTKQTYPDDVNMGALDYFVGQVAGKGGVDALHEFEKKGDLSGKAIQSTFGIGPEYGNHDVFKDLLKRGILEQALTAPASFDMWPIYKYDDKGSKTISVVTNYNVPNKCASKDFEPTTTPSSVKEIPITYDKNKCPLKNGTVLLRKVYDEQSGRFVDDKTTYKVQNGAIVTSNGEEIAIDDTVLNFYVPSESQLEAKRNAKFH